jgi:hypothetical protein
MIFFIFSDSSSEGSEGSNDGDNAKCKLCSGTKKKNKLGQSESMIKCAQCECKSECNLR